MSKENLINKINSLPDSPIKVSGKINSSDIKEILKENANGYSENDLTDELKDKLESNVITLDGNETITGVKSIIGIGELLNFGNSLLDGRDGWITLGNDAPYSWKIKYVGSTSGKEGNEFRIESDSTGKYYQMDHYGNMEYFDGTTLHKIWNGANDGAGSGLDADKVDGIHADALIQNTGLKPHTQNGNTADGSLEKGHITTGPNYSGSVNYPTIYGQTWTFQGETGHRTFSIHRKASGKELYVKYWENDLTSTGWIKLLHPEDLETALSTKVDKPTFKETVLPVGESGWYTIATCVNGRAIGRFGLKDTASGRHQTCVFYASHLFGAGNTINVLSNATRTFNPIEKIRIKDKASVDGAALQIYLNTDTLPTNLGVYLLDDNFQANRWVLTTLTKDSIAPTGIPAEDWGTYQVNTVEVDLLLGNGSLNSSGDVYAKNKKLVTEETFTTAINSKAEAGHDHDDVYKKEYYRSISVYGDADKYYPVIINNGDQDIIRDLLIYRSYKMFGPSTWFSATHKGALTAHFKVNFGLWGGAEYKWKLMDYRKNYAQTLGGAQFTNHFKGFLVFLRGGGAEYRMLSNQPLDNVQIAYSSSDITFEHSNPAYVRYAPEPLDTPNIQQINDHIVPTNKDVDDRISDKVEKESGKGLSTNDYNDADKAKLDSIHVGRLIYGDRDSGITLINDDVFNVDKSGFYYATTNALNKPTGTIGYFIVEALSDDYRKITYANHKGNGVYTNYRSAGVWQGWQKNEVLTPELKQKLDDLPQHIVSSDSNGNIGIGIENPTVKLDIGNLGSHDGIHLGTFLKLRNSGVGSDAFVMEQINPTGNLYVRSQSLQQYSGNLILNDIGGNVGVGTTSPQDKLHINGGKLRVQTPTGYATFGSDNSSYFHISTDRQLFFFSSSAAINGDIKVYGTDTYMRKSDGAIFENNKRVATQSYVDQSQQNLRGDIENNIDRDRITQMVVDSGRDELQVISNSGQVVVSMPLEDLRRELLK